LGDADRLGEVVQLAADALAQRWCWSCFQRRWRGRWARSAALDAASMPKIL
jgi:hypothetical protein